MSGSDERRALQAAVAGRYTLDVELGRGGMGVVFLARDLALERTVAIKLLPGTVARDADARAAFLREARIAAGLSHPNIVSIHLVEERGDLIYFVMAHVEGETLAQRVRRAGPLTVDAALRLLQETAWALAYAHGRGVVHRDVKPENVMLERGTDRALVMDFGIAQRGDGRAAPAGEIVGTAQFMSPEQAQGGPVDPRSDLYSLGVTAFYALTGRLPFDAPSPVGVMAQHLTRSAPPVAGVRPGLPPALAAIVDRCLAKSPDERFPTGEALADAIGAIRAAMPVVPPVIRRWQRAFQVVRLLAPVFAIVLTWILLMAPAGAAAVGLLLGSVWVLSGLDLLSHTRIVAAAGFGPADVAAAFTADARQRHDEAATGGRVLAALHHTSVVASAGLAGVAALALAVLLPSLGVQSAHWRVKLAFVGTFLLALIVPVALGAPGRARSWARWWSGALGRFWFAVARVGLRGSASGR
jgi:serine/threonine-protein kinase